MKTKKNRTERQFSDLEPGFIRRFDTLIRPVKFIIPEIPLRFEKRRATMPDLGEVAIQLFEDRTDGEHKRNVGLESLTRPLGQNAISIYRVGLTNSQYAEMAPDAEIDWSDPTLQAEDVFSNERPLAQDDFQLVDRLFDFFETGEIVRNA
jgi:hypothetical protein